MRMDLSDSNSFPSRSCASSGTPEPWDNPGINSSLFQAFPRQNPGHLVRYLQNAHSQISMNPTLRTLTETEQCGTNQQDCNTVLELRYQDNVAGG